MNKEYSYYDGIAIVKDDKDNQKPVEYTDKLDDILVQENLIETIENDIKCLEKEKRKYKIVKPKTFIPPFSIACILSIMFLPAFMYYYFGDTSIYIREVNTIFGAIKSSSFYQLGLTLGALPISLCIDALSIYDHKHFLKREKGIDQGLEFSRKQLEKEKEKLNELIQKQEKVKREENFALEKINDVEKLREFKNMLYLYYNIGKNYEKYSKYYQQGILEEKLKKKYPPEEIEFSKEILKEQGPVKKLVRNNKNKRD